MKENYEYPIEFDWTKDEMIAVVELLRAVEMAYESKISAKEVLTKYQNYKKYFKAIKDEKVLDRNFAKVSGYSLYKVISKAKSNQEAVIKM